MSDMPETTRAKPGTASDRSPLQQVGGISTVTGAVGFFVATADWGFRSYAAGHVIAPDNALLTIWGTAMAPIIYLIQLIAIKRLKKAAEE